MNMETISSRKNPFIRHLRSLSHDGSYRAEQGEFLCDGQKLLDEALSFGAEVTAILWKDRPPEREYPCRKQFLALKEIYDYASPMENSPGPLFSVKMKPADTKFDPAGGVIVLEGVQDPGNVGTVIRTANAFGISAVVLTGGCADRYNPKTVRATMGAVFRQRVLAAALEELPALLKEKGLKLYGAALSDNAKDLRQVCLDGAAVAVGSEGRGLSRELLDICDGEIIIPMNPNSESLNAAVAASVLMWEMGGKKR